MTVTPNHTLRAVRMGMMLSQDEMARRLVEAGALNASKRLVQRWEAGTTAAPQPAYARALEVVTGLPAESLGFKMPVPPAHSPGEMPTAVAQPAAARGAYSGVWRSRYEYLSSSRGESFADERYVLLLHHGDRVTVRSLPGSADGEVTMDLSVDGYVVTGTWVEVTSRDGYYRGARYHGAIQMIAEPTGRRMAGKWIGFDRDMGVSTGPWSLTLEDQSTNAKVLERYNRRPEQGPS